MVRMLGGKKNLVASFKSTIYQINVNPVSGKELAIL